MAFFQKCFGGGGGGSASISTCSRKQRHSTTIEHLCHRFSLSQLRQSTDDFHESRIIGGGPYGVAYRASVSVNGQLKDVAVKRLRRTSSMGLSMYKNDVLFACQLHHPNLLSLLGFCYDHNEMIVVHEFAPNGSLYNHLYRNPPTPFSWKRRLEIAIGGARGLHYLHSGTKRTIIHCNIHPVTIMLDENWVPKISFFGVSKKAPKNSEKDVKRRELESESVVVEGNWESPHVLHKWDVYCFGELLKELILFNDEGKIDERFAREIAKECWVLYMHIADSSLNKDPYERPDMGEVEVQLERVLQLQEEADTNP